VTNVYTDPGAVFICWYHPVFLLDQRYLWKYGQLIIKLLILYARSHEQKIVAWRLLIEVSDKTNRNLTFKLISSGFCIGLSIAYLCLLAQDSVI
jgi:hypothetical protein